MTEAILIPVDTKAAVDRIVAVIDSVPESHRSEVFAALLERLDVCQSCGSIDAGLRCCDACRPG